MKVLFFDSYLSDTLNGGDMGLRRNLKMAEAVFGKENITVCKLHNPSKLRGLLNFFFDHSFYYSNTNNKEIKKALNNRNYDLIFLNGPLFYKYVDKFKSSNTIVYLYCHNVDYEYALNKYVLSHKISDFLWKNYVKRMEAYTVKNSDVISTLNQRDSNGLLKWYGREADFILPIAMDRLDDNDLKPEEVHYSPYGLFVGSSIGPNIEGLIWFFKNVAPFTPKVEYRIVGSCCEHFQSLSLPENIILEGRVEDLSKFYRNASFVICPIFSGSGMKTKTIEALQYGKTIIGTQEAFEGIDVPFNLIGLKSDNATDQINKINSLDLYEKLNQKSLKEFREKFSSEIIIEKFRKEIENIKFLK